MEENVEVEQQANTKKKRNNEHERIENICSRMPNSSMFQNYCPLIGESLRFLLRITRMVVLIVAGFLFVLFMHGPHTFA